MQPRASHTTHAFIHGHRLGVIPSKRAFSEQIKFVEGSRRSRNGSGSSGTCLVEELDVHGVDSSGTHVVGVLDESESLRA